MTDALPPLNYPEGLPVVGMRREIVAAIRDNPVIVMVSETGSGKTTQLPKMVAEALAGSTRKIGCTQPRRIAAAGVVPGIPFLGRVPMIQSLCEISAKDVPHLAGGCIEAS